MTIGGTAASIALQRASGPDVGATWPPSRVGTVLRRLGMRLSRRGETGWTAPEDAPPCASVANDAGAGMADTTTDLYRKRLAEEIDFHKDYLDISSLPEIFGYWSNTYIRPMLERVVASNPNDFIAQELAKSARRCRADNPVFISIGAGNCDVEVEIG